MMIYIILLALYRYFAPLVLLGKTKLILSLNTLCVINIDSYFIFISNLFSLDEI
jgi:hypothetical protein